MALSLTNDTIYLRALEPEDIDIIYRWENDAALWRHGSTTAPFSRQQIWEYLQGYSADIYAQRQLRLMVCLCDGDEAVGMIDLFDFDPNNRRASVGVIVDRKHQRKGYASSALAMLVEYSRSVLHLHQLSAQVAVDNEASMQTFDSQDFIRVGELHDWLLRDGGYIDVVQLQLILD